MTTDIAPSDIEIHRLFATPIASTGFPDAGNLNAGLSELILRRSKKEVSTQHSNVGGWQSRDDFCSWDEPPVTALLEFATAFVTQLTAENSPSGLVEPTRPWHVEGWANVNYAGCSNAIHGHPGAFWSAVYWVDDGGHEASPEVGGELDFYDPRGLLPATYAPSLRFRIEGCLSAGYTQTASPRTGRIVVFPSWLLHSVRPYNGTQPRISVALNFSI
ncbi:TIGR02466 family protein [Herbaspirillum sp. RTI4]|uniref:TIGR02466 family protein n=1 Tax=Herbaspirillum sp. RTI4 TaxID=3048640 RepID=UPI002AB5B09D|nr:TIGR02466 family protein [Herbaspirillum sp. RTI4]MDY7580034.1 TIGR02466 family protein [Herbaspirillum sp. RTI4]MEA9982983.1 TIGR02466 family protein [Herbaspirillum sp. RTI4]